MKRIHLISSPRNVSTAFMYAFAQRDDTTVIDEPFYTYFLKNTDIEHPDKEKIMSTMESDIRCIIEKQIYGNYDTKIVFFKNMAHHILDMDETFMESLDNIFLIRNPKQLIASLAQIIEKPQMRDIGVLKQYHLFQQLKKIGKTPIVIDSGILLQNPEQTFRQLCARCEIPFQKNMLSWKKGGIPEDGIWAKYWYSNVHRSTSFQVQSTSKRPLPEQFEPLYQESLPYYTALSKYELTKLKSYT